MTITLGEALSQTREALDESSAVFWLDVNIRKLINDAVRDIARRTETIQVKDSTVAASAGDGEYDLPTHIQRVHKIEFVPTGQNQTYPMSIATRQEMDPIWGLNQGQQSSYPSFAVLWGYPGGATTLKMQVYPVPTQGGTFHIYHYKVPTRLATDGTADASTLEIPEGWEDLVVQYAEWRAKRKDRDPTWQEAKAIYEEEVTRMSEMLRHWHDQQQFITTATGAGIPRWLYDFNYAD